MTEVKQLAKSTFNNLKFVMKIVKHQNKKFYKMASKKMNRRLQEATEKLFSKETSTVTRSRIRRATPIDIVIKEDPYLHFIVNKPKPDVGFFF